VPANRPLTVRGLDGTLRSALEREAARRGKSLNKTVLALLAESLGLAHGDRVALADDLDELAGTWSKSEAARFDESLRAQRQVDPKLWR
jgi:plasmid stability protein